MMETNTTPIELKKILALKECLEEINDQMDFYLEDKEFYKQGLMEDDYKTYLEDLLKINNQILKLNQKIKSKKAAVENKIKQDLELNAKFHKTQERLVTLHQIESYVSCDVYSGEEEIWMCNELISLKNFKNLKTLFQYIKNKYAIQDKDIFCAKKIIF